MVLRWFTLVISSKEKWSHPFRVALNHAAKDLK